MPHCVRDLGHLSFHRGPEAHPTKCNARFFKAQKTQGTECCFCEIIAQRALYAVVSTLDLRWAEPWELGAFRLLEKWGKTLCREGVYSKGGTG